MYSINVASDNEDFMIKLQTPVSLPQRPSSQLRYGQPLLSFGSCFSEHIGRRLAELGYDITVNPFGIQYNPLSIAYGLERLIQGKSYLEDELIHHSGLYHSFDHHGSFSSVDASEALQKINSVYSLASSRLRKASHVLITWGTAFVYKHGTTGAVVNNCHKLPECTFIRSLCSLPECVEHWTGLLGKLFEANPTLQIIQTVSPIRHLRDGAVANQISKSTLILLSSELSERFRGRVHYFPAYEIVQDELRDYRFYAEDMTHPSAQTVGYIAEQFVAWACDSEDRQLMPYIERLRLAYEHRPLNPELPEALLQREQLMQRIRAFIRSYPQIVLSSWLKPEDR